MPERRLGVVESTSLGTPEALGIRVVSVRPRGADYRVCMRTPLGWGYCRTLTARGLGAVVAELPWRERERLGLLTLTTAQ